MSITAATNFPTAKMMTSKSQQLATHIQEQLNTEKMLSKRYEQLYHSEKYYDFVFHIEGTNVKCHKLILSAASPVFEAMFFGPIKEQQQQIEILDISPDIFKHLIKYIYSGAVEFEQLNLEATIELYYGSEKYMLNELINECLQAITHKLRFNNILEALELSICWDLSGLVEVCMSFFMRCCLSDPQYMTYLKANYVHVSKECIKRIIAACGELPPNHLLFFVYEWCHQECAKLGLQKDDCALIINELQMKNGGDMVDLKQAVKQSSPTELTTHCISIERCYYRACRPFLVDIDAHEWKLLLKSNRFISLHGLIMHSRLPPSTTMTRFPNEYLGTAMSMFPNEYFEQLDLEVSVRDNHGSTAPPPSSLTSDSEGDSEHEIEAEGEVRGGAERGAHVVQRDQVIWRHTISQQTTKYNCDLNLRWTQGVILAPDREYTIKLKWPLEQTNGAEYPCSLQSNLVDGIQFRDLEGYNGSIIKGLHFKNLV